MVHPGRAILNRDQMIDGLPPTSPLAPLPRSGFVLRPNADLNRMAAQRPITDHSWPNFLARKTYC